MRIHRGAVATRELIELGPEIADRMTLASVPDGASVGFYVLTRGAQRAWEAINAQLDGSHGDLFWIAGPAGSGKTHFLNYVYTLADRAGSLSAEPARNLAFALEIGGQVKPGNLDRHLLEMIARELVGDRQGAAPPLWRQMRGGEALSVALDQARRQGVKSMTAVIDFGAAESEPAVAHLKTLAELAHNVKQPKLLAIVAGRSPKFASSFPVAPEPDEEMQVAIGRARKIADAAIKVIDDLYRGIDTRTHDSRAIFPFHPVTVDTLNGLVSAASSVAPRARLVRDALVQWYEAKSTHRMVYPADLMHSDEVRRVVETRIGEAGRAALEISHAALTAVDAQRREAAQEIVDTLALRLISGDSPWLELEELRACIPAFAEEHGHGVLPVLADLLGRIAPRTRGVIVFDPQSQKASFDPRGAGAPEVAAFNAALPLIRRFDSTLTAAQEMPELKAKLKRIGDAMASALEGAFRNRETLEAAMQEAGRKLTDDQAKTIAEFITLAEAGPQAVVQRGADEDRRKIAIQTVAAYESLAALAAAVPTLRSMREYLQATGLQLRYEDDPTRDRQLAALETECQVVGALIDPAALAGAARNLDALEATFQKFKWTYVQFYRSAHEQWRIEMERLGPIAEDARRYTDALRRLNSIVALGPPEGDDLAQQMTAMDQRLVRCDLHAPLAPEVTPRCPQCGFVLGTVSPREDLKDLFERARRALRSKLVALSLSTIARIIEEHDHNHRLEGFLKITQAAQTDALTRVLDDKLTRYLAQLLDENLAVPAREAGTGALVQTLHDTRFKRQGAPSRRASGKGSSD
jgi:hypothetical protein